MKGSHRHVEKRSMEEKRRIAAVVREQGRRVAAERFGLSVHYISVIAREVSDADATLRQGIG